MCNPGIQSEFLALSLSLSCMKGKWCCYPVQRMMASIRYFDLSEKWHVVPSPSILVSIGTLIIELGHLNGLAAVRCDMIIFVFWFRADELHIL